MKKQMQFSTFVMLLGIQSVTMASSVVLDVGHSPKQFGATGANGIPEYSYNLNMTNSIEDMLKKQQVKVLRSTDQPNHVTLAERATRHPDANLFVSIHHDSNSKELDPVKDQLKGFSIFVSKKNPQYQASLKCADLVAKNLKSIGEVPSTYHGLNIKGENKKLLTANGVYQYDNLIVLKTSKKPAILIEIGVISNPSEAERLKNQPQISKISANIAQSIQQCLNDLK